MTLRPVALLLLMVLAGCSAGGSESTEPATPTTAGSASPAVSAAPTLSTSFVEDRLRRIEASVAHGNTASLSVLARLGFLEVAHEDEAGVARWALDTGQGHSLRSGGSM